jgi:hypothetical protein
VYHARINLKINYLNHEKLEQFKSALLFLHVSEVREIALKLFLSDLGNKTTVILRICLFLQTGEKINFPKFSKESLAMKGIDYPLTKCGLMLKGAYKNNLEFRQFLKKLLVVIFISLHTE